MLTSRYVKAWMRGTTRGRGQGNGVGRMYGVSGAGDVSQGVGLDWTFWLPPGKARSSRGTLEGVDRPPET